MKSNLKSSLMIGSGGMIGAIGRYLISLFTFNYQVFPYATLFTNMIGCFLLSYLLNQKVIKQKLSPDLFMALTIGVIGSFTTFSTVTLETVQLWSTHRLATVLYVVLTLLGGLLFCYGGFKTASRKHGDI